MRRIRSRRREMPLQAHVFDPLEMPYLSLSSLELKAAAFSELAASLPFGADQKNAVGHMTSLRTFAAMKRLFHMPDVVDLVLRGH